MNRRNLTLTGAQRERLRRIVENQELVIVQIRQLTSIDFQLIYENGTCELITIPANGADVTEMPYTWVYSKHIGF